MELIGNPTHPLIFDPNRLGQWPLPSWYVMLPGSDEWVLWSFGHNVATSDILEGSFIQARMPTIRKNPIKKEMREYTRKG